MPPVLLPSTFYLLLNTLLSQSKITPAFSTNYQCESRAEKRLSFILSFLPSRPQRSQTFVASGWRPELTSYPSSGAPPGSTSRHPSRSYFHSTLAGRNLLLRPGIFQSSDRIITNLRSPSNYQLPTTNYQLPTTNYLSGQYRSTNSCLIPTSETENQRANNSHPVSSISSVSILTSMASRRSEYSRANCRLRSS